MLNSLSTSYALPILFMVPITYLIFYLLSLLLVFLLVTSHSSVYGITTEDNNESKDRTTTFGTDNDDDDVEGNDGRLGSSSNALANLMSLTRGRFTQQKYKGEVVAMQSVPYHSTLLVGNHNMAMYAVAISAVICC